jgi:hypothetical protein
VLLEPYTGRITWVTGPGNGPSVQQLTLEVLDSGSPRMGAARSFKITVTDVNTAPVLEAIPDQMVAEGQLLVLQLRALDVDLPRQTLTYSFAAAPPPAAVLDEVTGLFTWRPADHQGGRSYPVRVAVKDNGTPTLSVTGQFQVFVQDTRNDFTVHLGTTNTSAGQSASLPLELESGSDLTRVTFLLELTDPHLINLELHPFGEEVLAASLEPLGDGLFRVQMRLDPARTQSGIRPVGRLQFDTVQLGRSAAVRLEVDGLAGERLGGEVILNGAARAGRVFVVENEPLLEAVPGAAPGAISLTLFGKPGARYRLLRSASLSPSSVWSTDHVFELTTSSAVVSRRVEAAAAAYYRAVAD